MEDKKNLILNAALVVFSNEGFHKAKMSKIAEIAGVGAGTLYLYFKNKETILEELFIRSWSRIEAKLLDIHQIRNISAKQKISLIIEDIVEMAVANDSIAKMILHEYSFWSSGPSQKLNEAVDNSKFLISKIIIEGIINGEFNNMLNAADSTTFIIAGTWHFLASKSEFLNNSNKELLTETLNRLILSGIC